MGNKEGRQPKETPRTPATRFGGISMRIKEFFQSFDVGPISASPFHGPITQEMIDYMQQRNEEKRKLSIEQLGSKWLLHPDNREQRKDFQ